MNMQMAVSRNLSELKSSPAPVKHDDTNLRHMFYRCEFPALLASIESLELADVPERSYIDIHLLKANALYELGRVEESLALLKGLDTFRQIHNPCAFLYSVARVHYHEGAYEKALKAFLSIIERASEPSMRFRGLLGAANVYYSLEKTAQVPALLAELEHMKGQVSEEERISLILLQANHYRSTCCDGILASKYYQLAIAAAAAQAWTFFQLRGLYGLALIAQSQGDRAGQRALLSVLSAMISTSHASKFAQLVKDRFPARDEELLMSLELDSWNMRIRSQGEWHALHHQPLVFNFINLLFTKADFCRKGQIAAALWPDQSYQARTHDARIFDIAKRARRALSQITMGRIVMLSGRQGYKITMKTQSEQEASL